MEPTYLKKLPLLLPMRLLDTKRGTIKLRHADLVLRPMVPLVVLSAEARAVLPSAMM